MGAHGHSCGSQRLVLWLSLPLSDRGIGLVPQLFLCFCFHVKGLQRCSEADTRALPSPVGPMWRRASPVGLWALPLLGVAAVGGWDVPVSSLFKLFLLLTCPAR